MGIAYKSSAFETKAWADAIMIFKRWLLENVFPDDTLRITYQKPDEN